MPELWTETQRSLFLTHSVVSASITARVSFAIAGPLHS